MGSVPAWVKIAVPSTVVAGLVAIGVTSAGRADRARVLHDEWGQLLTCLAQAGDPVDAPRLAARMRAVELGYATSVEPRRGRQLRKEWLARCSIRAGRLQEIARRHEGGASAHLLDATDEVADSLRAGRRPTRDALRDLLEAGTESGLDTEHLPAPQPGPSAGVLPRLASTEAALPPLATTPLSLSAWDPVPDLDAHFVLEGSGQPDGPRLACLATKEGGELLGSIRCARVPDGASDQTNLRFESVAKTDTHALAMVDADKVTLHQFRDGTWSAAGFATGELETLIGVSGVATAVVQTAGGDVELLPLAAGARATRARFVRSPAWMIPIGSDLVWATTGNGPVRGRILTTALGAVTAEAPEVRPLGERIEPGVPLACEDGPTRALLVDRPRPGGASAVARSAELFVARDGSWAQVPITPSWTARPSVGVSSPRTPVLDCWRDDVVLTWADGDEQDRLRQTRCSKTGCRSKVTALGTPGRDLLHADLGERVLLVWNDAEHHVVRFRLAPFEGLASAADEVLVDYDDDTSDPPPIRAEHVLTRDDAALVLLRVERKDRTSVAVVRIDGKGAVRTPKLVSVP